MQRSLSRLSATVIALVALCAGGNAATVPAGFSESTFAAGIGGGITGMDWAPDGSSRLFVTVKNGPIRIVKNGALLPTPFHTFAPYTNSECGVLGLCFDPDFLTTKRIFVFVTVSDRVQRIVSLTDANNDDVADAGPVTVIDNLPTLGVNHDGGGVGIGHDNKLYWAVGDQGDARIGLDGDLASLASKVGRANLDGTVPGDNPFVDGAGGNNDYIWARGVRNPFTLTFQPTTGALWVDVVGDNWEQVFHMRAGDHAGDRTRENNQPTGYIRPQIAYATNGGGSFGGCITGGTFYSGSALPAEFQGNFFFGDYNSGKIMRAVLDGSGNVASTNLWISGASQAIDVVGGPDGALYYASYGGTIWRLINQPASQDIVLSTTSLRVNEGRSAVLTVRLATAPGSNVSVAIARTAGDGDVAVGSGMNLVFTPGNWATPQTVRIDAAEDGDMANDGATLAATASGLTTRTVAVNATDNDLGSSAPVILVSTGVLTIAEGGSGTVTVRLQDAPSANVVVAVARTAGDGDVAVTGGSSLTFTPANYASPQTVTIAAAEDGDAVNDSATVSASAAGATTRTVAVMVTDNDASPPAITTTADTTATVNVEYIHDVNANGNPAPTFSLTTFPTGMTIHPASGQINWTPGATGTVTVTVRATNGVAPDATQSWQLVVAADQPPVATVTNPVANQVLSGATAEWYGDGRDDVGTTKAEFYVDGVLRWTDVGTGGHHHFGGGHNLFDTRAYSNGPHTLTMVVYDSAGQTGSRAVTVTIDNAAIVPAPWSTADVGSVGVPGAAAYSGGVFTLDGSGTDIWDNVDGFRFVHQGLNGDGTIVARVTGVEYTDGWAKAGVMIRESLSAGSRHAMVVVTPGAGVAFQRRMNTESYSDHTAASGSLSAPRWVRLVRSGTTFSGATSADGVNWSAIGSATVAMGASVHVGLAVTAHNNGTLCTAGFDNVSVSASASIPGLVHAWKLDEGSGLIAIDGPGTNDGTLANGPAWAAGMVAGALRFDGSDDHVALPADLAPTLGGTATVTAWIRTSQIGHGTFWLAPGITGVEQAGAGNDIFWGWLDGSGRIGMQAGDAPSAKSANPINDDSWRHIALTRNAATGMVQVYVDGSLSGSATSGTGQKTTPIRSLGRIEDTGGTPAYLHGVLDDVRIYNRVLSPAEVNAIAVGGAPLNNG
ncbi:MAG: PQQ-dependent sugar dehydrogenase [Planctomycetes bacterium]|nr:PQQ-dependent sugar dehydrogenase [Planctomycetota bacterium]